MLYFRSFLIFYGNMNLKVLFSLNKLINSVQDPKLSRLLIVLRTHPANTFGLREEKQHCFSQQVHTHKHML